MTPRSLYIPHGGGPMPLLGDPGHAEMVDYLESLGSEFDRPSAIVVISAHWEEPVPTVTAGPNPELLFDYYGFPAQAYEFTYPAPGSTELAQRLASALGSAGFAPRLDTNRGFDHGVFVPLLLMYPAADIPVVQVSLVHGLDASDHVRLGEALRPALDSGVLVLGSGMSFHNMGAFGSGPNDPDNLAFDEWLEQICTDDRPEAERRQQLTEWERAPAARYNHPREEHLIPLHVCYGVGGGAATRTFNGTVGKRVAAYSWL